MKLPQLQGLEPVNRDVTSEEYGCDPFERPIDLHIAYGFIPMDKPPGPTSHEVVAWTKKILHVGRAGHSGTLDPPATGLLPIGLEEGTKTLGALLLGSKEYIAVARIHHSVGEDKLRAVLSEFSGPIYQRPPQRSSVKRVTRVRNIYELELVEKRGNLLVLRLSVEAGTYVRKLVYDMGEALGVGATMVELRRTRVAGISERDGLVRLQDLYVAYQDFKAGGGAEGLRRLIWPIERALAHLKAVVVRDSAVDALCHGAQLAIPGIESISPAISKGELVGIYTLKGELVALGRALLSTDEVLAMKKGIAFTTERVIMRPGTYPRMWRKRAEVPAQP
jgi:H/ACA ribonucleoprotein complex subunit 4